jgi:hypothetical protein
MIGTATAPGPCEEKARLIDLYTQAVVEHSECLRLLQERLPIIRKYEYERIRVLTENYRKFSEKAREALERHTAEHGC